MRNTRRRIAAAIILTVAPVTILAESVVLPGQEAFTVSAGGPPLSIDVGRGPVGVHSPPSYDPGTPMPLVLLLHGYSSSGAGQEGYMQFTPLADEFGFLYLHPDGRNEASANAYRFWSATTACCNFFGAPDSDADYIMALVTEMKALFNVDPMRVYLVGHSNGGFMSQRMACEHSDTFAAIATLAGSSFFDADDCQPTGNVHALQIHGTADNNIEYFEPASTYTSNPPAGFFPGAVELSERWAAKNGCDVVADTSAPNIDLERNLAGDESTVMKFASSCDTGGSSELWSIINGGHVPALSSTFSRQVVEWLYAHPKKLDEAWVDFDWTGTRLGLEGMPFSSLADGLNAAVSSGTVKVKGDTGDNSSSETVTVGQAVTIEAVGGPVTIGAPEVRVFKDNIRSGFIARR